MVALDNHAIFGSVPRLRVKLASLVAGIALVSVAVVLGAIGFRGFAENDVRLGRKLAWRYTLLLFFAATVVEAACRLTARLVPDFAWPERLSRKLFWGFCAS